MTKYNKNVLIKSNQLSEYTKLYKKNNIYFYINLLTKLKNMRKIKILRIL